ncbi:LuxR family transcriptional regulator [Coriobacteriales bacterium OH1046]|nr:LuxR family transcriptional regulator [Coriobacteriales bacterium OH1046]
MAAFRETRRALVFWGAILFAMPHPALDSLLKVRPFSVSYGPMAVALVLVIAVAPLLDSHTAGLPEAHRKTLSMSGMVATYALILSELSVIAINLYSPNGQLLSEKPEVITIQQMLEWVLTIWTFFAWGMCLRGQWERGAARHPLALCAGALLPIPVHIAAEMAGENLAASVLLCIAVGVLLYAAINRLTIAPGDPSLWCCGFLAFRVAEKCFFDISLQSEIGLSPFPYALPVVFALCVIVWTLVEYLRRRKIDEQSDPSSDDGESQDLPEAEALIVQMETRAGSRLSDRERSVVMGTLRGKSARTLADELSLAPSTVSSFRARAYQKLQVCDMEDLMRIADEERYKASSESSSIGFASHLTTGRKAIVGGLWLITSIAFLLFSRAPGLLNADGQPMLAGEPYLASLIAVVLLGLGGALLPSSCCEEQSLERSPSYGGLLDAAAFFAPCYIIFNAWWFGLPYRVLAVAILLLSLIAQTAISGQGAQNVNGLQGFAICALEYCDEAIRRYSIHILAALGFIASLGVSNYAVFWLPQWTILDLYIPMNNIICLSSLVFCSVVAGLEIYKFIQSQRRRTVDSDALAKLTSAGITGLQATVALDLARGLGQNEIVRLRYVAPSTVKTYRIRTYKALCISTHSELQKYLGLQG